MNIIAIDPGQSGGIAFEIDGKLAADSMPSTTADLIDHLRSLSQFTPGVVVVIEELVKFAGKDQSGSSSIVYGKNYGIIEGVCMALGLRLEKVRAQQWQGNMGLKRAKKLKQSEWKNKLKARAQELFPGMTVTLKTADALLILEWARRYRGMV